MLISGGQTKHRSLLKNLATAHPKLWNAMLRHKEVCKLTWPQTRVYVFEQVKKGTETIKEKVMEVQQLTWIVYCRELKAEVAADVQ